LAVDVRLEVTAQPSEADAFVYTGDGDVASTPDNLVHQGFKAAFAKLGRTAPAVRFEVRNPIPLARGLGSSSAALVAGALAGDAFSGGELGRSGVFELTAGIEGHPDNVAPALFGGFTVSAGRADGFVSRSLPWPDGWALAFAVPSWALSTEHARSVLPNQVSRGDAVHNASGTALWATAVATRDPQLLRVAADDRLHQPHRAPLLPGFEQACSDLHAAGMWAAFLSGAGPTLGCVGPQAALADAEPILRRYAGADGQVLNPDCATGATVEDLTPA
jgi:homoserine kinase